MRLQTEELSNWIQSYSWDYFLTVTTRTPRTDPLALMRDTWDFLSSENTKMWSMSDDLKLPYRAFLACEPHAFSHRLHVHGMLKGYKGIMDHKWLQEGLNERFGFSRVESCRSLGDVADYCSKYVTKWTDGDNYDFFGSWTTGRQNGQIVLI